MRAIGKAGLDQTSLPHYSFSVSTVSEIRATLPRLTTEELQAVDAALREQFRERKVGILYDDAYGTWTEQDQASAAAEAFALMDRSAHLRQRRVEPVEHPLFPQNCD